ncbi:hypothetical protein [Desulfoscipio gibsoniae]|uniref:Oligopeptide transport permease C-like N-terminal domain-containing protein n=1 Tax=Desulfoscipio gibsoniae DSM 7213 TaxID=767817 RepID=R4KIV1_9FIRM|nr:hypothetical protein [Desulfoscipio gibsoniae]AGL00465.1 hypothetical protein Desgi_0919 [Desulfoscipio gibsoniae DSM 7213]
MHINYVQRVKQNNIARVGIVLLGLIILVALLGPVLVPHSPMQAKVLKLLLNLQEKRGLAILFITHDIALARKMSDRIAVMWEGRIVEEGPAGEITANPRTEYARQLLQNAANLRVRDKQL